MVACGGMHTVALTTDNKLYSWGINDDGALGRPTKEGDLWPEADAKDCCLECLPGAMHLPEEVLIVSATAGGGHTLALGDDGQVLACGSFRENSGPMGFSPDVQVQRVMTPVIPKSVVKISSGEQHCLALTSTGTVLTWGCGENGRLARDGPQLIPAPAKTVKAVLTRVTNATACQQNSFAVSIDGKVFGWGLNNAGQIGLPSEKANFIGRAAEIEALSALGIKQIAGGNRHTLALTHAGRVYSFGTPTYGVLGQEGVDTVGMDPAPLPDPGQVHGLPMAFSVSAVFAGQNVSGCIVKGDGLYMWGSSDTEQLGLGTETVEACLPTKVRRAGS